DCPARMDWRAGILSLPVAQSCKSRARFSVGQLIRTANFVTAELRAVAASSFVRCASSEQQEMTIKRRQALIAMLVISQLGCMTFGVLWASHWLHGAFDQIIHRSAALQA